MLNPQLSSPPHPGIITTLILHISQFVLHLPWVMLDLSQTVLGCAPYFWVMLHLSRVIHSFLGLCCTLTVRCGSFFPVDLI